jgi:hypothetical protein
MWPLKAVRTNGCYEDISMNRFHVRVGWDYQDIDCHIDRDCAKEIHGGNQAKYEYQLASNCDWTEIIRVESSSKAAARTRKTSK